MATDEATPTTIAGSPNRRGRMELLYTPPLLENTIHCNSIFAITNTELGKYWHKTFFSHIFEVIIHFTKSWI